MVMVIVIVVPIMDRDGDDGGDRWCATCHRIIQIPSWCLFRSTVKPPGGPR